jgi:predicted sugar kinase
MCIQHRVSSIWRGYVTSITDWLQEFALAPLTRLPRNVYHYVLGTSALHQTALLALTASVALLEVAPLELQRRIVNHLVKRHPHSWAISLCAAYLGVVIVRGGTKPALNIYRSRVGERAKRDI